MAAVSVVIPTYNRASMLAEALASVRSQTFTDFEIIVADDGSDDGTEDLVRRLAGVKYLRLGHAGVAAARNAGVDAARGDYVAFLDSDDLWRPRKLSAQMAFFRAESALAVCQTEEIWVRNGRRVNARQYHQKPRGWVLGPSLERCLVSPSAVMLQRSVFHAVGRFDTSLPACEDYDLWLRIAPSFEVGLVPEPLVIKRGGHADQLSRRHWGMDRFRIAAICRLLASGMLAAEDRDKTGQVLVAKATILARGASKRGKVEEAQRYLAVARWAREVSAGANDGTERSNNGVRGPAAPQ